MNANDTRVFAPSNTGTKAHAFLGSWGAKDGNLRAACRVTIQRAATGTTFISLDRARKLYTVCDNCVKLFLAAEDRAESSMQPATEADDLGYVAPVDERTEIPQPAAEATPDLSTEDQPLRDRAVALADDSMDGRIWKLHVAARIVLKCQTCNATDRSVATMLDPFTTALWPEDTNHDSMTLCEPCAVARFEES